MKINEAAALIDDLLNAELEDSYPADAPGSEYVTDEQKNGFRYGYLKNLLADLLTKSAEARASVGALKSHVDERDARLTASALKVLAPD